jgi:hypothetical protein
MRTRSKIQQIVLATLFFGGITLWPSYSAAQTAAGTIISNTATASYTVSGGPTETSTDTIAFTVQEVIDVSLTWDSVNAIVDTPDTDQATTFTLLNSGNGTEEFELTVANVSSPTDDFDFTLPADVQIYIEDGTTAGFQLAEDTLYVFNTNDPVVAQGASETLYLVADIPGGQTHNFEGHLTLTADSTTVGAAGSAAGTTLTNLGDGGAIDAIVGSSQADASDTSIYQVNTVSVTVTKTVMTVLDEFGGTDLIPNAEVTYRIAVDVVGGTAEALTIVDPIPANTTYEPGTIQLELPPAPSVTLTDASDGDVGDYNLTNPGAVTVVLGDTVGGGGTINIDITVTID